MARDNEEDGQDEPGVVEVVTELRPRSRAPKRKPPNAADQGGPVENEEPIPLFPNLDKDSRNVIAVIEVHKMTPPNDGFKGTVPANTTKEYIGRRYGNGIYNFDACNAAGECLRRVQNVKIDFTPAEGVSPGAARPMPPGMFDGSMADRLLDRLSSEHEKSTQSAKELTSQTLKATQEQAATYAAMVREDAASRATRDREYFEAQQKQQNGFFSAMITQLQQLHSMNMESMQAGFTQTMALMEMNHRQAMNNSNPMLLFSLFERGLRFGQEVGGPDDPISTVMNGALRGLSDIKDMMVLQKGNAPPKLPKGKAAANGTKKAEKPGQKRHTVTRADVMKLARIKALAERGGYDFDAMMAQAERVVARGADGGGEPENDDSTSSEEDGETDVGGEGPTE